MTQEEELVQELTELSKFAHVFPFDKLDAKYQNMKAIEVCDRIPGRSHMHPKHYEGMQILADGKYTHDGLDEEEEEEGDDYSIEDVCSEVGKKRKREEEKLLRENVDIVRNESPSDTESPTEKEFDERYGGRLDYDATEHCQEILESCTANARNCLPINMVLGLEDAKHLLINNITKPIVNPGAFRGTLPPQKFLALTGQKGTGVSTLVRSFCLAMGIRLYIVLPHLSIEGMMKTVLNCSMDQKTVIFFDRCDHFFARGSPDASRGIEFKYHYEQYKLQKKNIWVVFSLTMAPEHMQDWFKERTVHHREVANTPNQQARERLLRRFIRHQYRKYTEKFPIPSKEFRRLILHLVRSSHCYTPAALLEYVKGVFRRKMDRCSLVKFKSMTKDCTCVLPVYADFMSMIHGTSDDPQLVAGGNFVRDQSIMYDNQTRHKTITDPQFSKPKDKRAERDENNRHSHRFSSKPPAPKRRVVNPIEALQKRPSLAKTTEQTKKATGTHVIVPKKALRMTDISRQNPSLSPAQ